MKNKKIISLFFALSFMIAGSVTAQMSGGSFSIQADTISVSEGGVYNGGTYQLKDTVGFSDTATSTGGILELKPGFQAVINGAVGLSVSESALSLGTPTVSSVVTSPLTTTVTTDSLTGYSLLITQDGNLRSGSREWAGVSDGSVSAGSEEYGIATAGAHGLLSADTAISNNLTVAATTAPAESDVTVVTFKAARALTTPAGTYSHTITFTVTANP